jgi:hypothetical protein
VLVDELVLVVVEELVVVLVELDELVVVVVLVEVELLVDVEDELVLLEVEVVVVVLELVELEVVVVELVDVVVVDEVEVGFEDVVVDGEGHATAAACRTSQTCASSRRSTPPAAPPKARQYASSPIESTIDAVSPGAGGTTSSGPSRPLSRAFSLRVPLALRLRTTPSTGPPPGMLAYLNRIPPTAVQPAAGRS